jgi:hypothetical protein
LGLVGMAVQGDPGTESLCSLLVAPQVVDRGIGHFPSLVRNLAWSFQDQYPPDAVNSALRECEWGFNSGKNQYSNRKYP